MLFFTITEMNSLINTWINSPTVLFIENTESPIQEIPFPTITVLSGHQLRKSVWDKYINTNTTTREAIQYYRSLICTSHLYATRSKFKEVEYLDYDTIKNVVNLKDFLISCPDLFQSTVTWQNTTIKNICDLVQPIMGILGIGFSINLMPFNQILRNEYYQKYKHFYWKSITFNYTERSKWNLDDGYPDNDLLDTYPLRTSGVSYYNRLSLTMNSIKDDFLACPNPSFKADSSVVLITSPYGLPLQSRKLFILPNTSTKIQITPIVKKIDSNLKWRSSDIRKCYFYNERKLVFFQHYSETDCYQECYINKTISLCGCISFMWPYLSSNKVKICGSVKNYCVKRAVVEVNLPKSRLECNCLPNCQTIQYDITESSHYNDWTYLKSTNLEKNRSTGLTTVEVVFKQPFFTTYKVESILDIYSFFSVVGGVLGLFLGLNILNIFEMFYVIIKMFIFYFNYILEKLRSSAISFKK